MREFFFNPIVSVLCNALWSCVLERNGTVPLHFARDSWVFRAKAAMDAKAGKWELTAKYTKYAKTGFEPQRNAENT